MHFNDLDKTGHGWGWGSKEQRAAIELCDQGIGVLRKAAQDARVAKLIFIVTADHGGHGKTHGSSDVRDMTIPWVCYGPDIVRPGQIEEAVSTCDTAATAVYALGLQADKRWVGKPLADIFIPVPQAAANAPRTNVVTITNAVAK